MQQQTLHFSSGNKMAGKLNFIELTPLLPVELFKL